MSHKKLNYKHRKGIRALLSNRNIRDASTASNIAERTLHSWLKDPLFRKELIEAENTLIDSAARRLISLQEKAIDEVEKILDSEDVTPPVRLRAIQTILDYSLKLKELITLESRVKELEEMFDDIAFEQ